MRPRDPDALDASAGLALSRHDFRRGLALARRARAARPGALAPAPLIVDALVELGRFGAAERELQRLVDAKPTLAGYARVSYLRELHGDLDGAVAAMRRAVAAGGAARESAASVHALLGGLELARGDLAAARRAQRAALAAVPDYPAALAGLARLAAARGDLAAAGRRWQALAERLPLPEYVVALGETRLAQGRARGRPARVPPRRRRAPPARRRRRRHGRRDGRLRGRPRRAPAGTGARAPRLARGARRAGRGRDGLGADARRARPRPGCAGRTARSRSAAATRSCAITRAWRRSPPAAIAEGRAHLRVALSGGLAGWPWQAQQARRALRAGGAT